MNEYESRAALAERLKAFTDSNKNLIAVCEMGDGFSEIEASLWHYMNACEEEDAERDYDRNRLSGDQLATPGRV